MTVHSTHLSGPLAQFGFAPGLLTPADGDLTFVRPGPDSDLYESVIVGRQGKRREAVYASVGVSVTWAVMYKTMGHVAHLLELGEDKERHWTIIEDDSKAREWARRLIEVAPARCAIWGQEKGPVLLETTTEARKAVSKYLARLDLATGSQSLLARFRRTASPEVNAEVDRLALSLGGGLGAPETEDAHYLAYFAILLFSSDVDPGRKFFGQVPVKDEEFMKRIHILADRIWQATHLGAGA